MGIYVKLGNIYGAHSPNMAMSRDPRKSYKISSKKALYFRSYHPKTSRGGVEKTVLLGLSRFMEILQFSW